MKEKKYGRCKLTKNNGKFVDSHIIPQGFIHKVQKEEPFMQPMGKGRAKKNWTGWYDSTIVIREGEDYLSNLDSWAISVLREKKLVWSGWNTNKTLQSSDHKLFSKEQGIREIENIDTQKLRLFFLSILWRAAVSSLSEFKEIHLSARDIEQLRTMIISGESAPSQFFPIHLIQLHTYGDTHLMAPTKSITMLPQNEKSKIKLETYRFSINGLIVHIENSAINNFSQYLGNLVVGSTTKLLLTTQDYNSSREKEIADKIMTEHVNEYCKFKLRK